MKHRLGKVIPWTQWAKELELDEASERERERGSERGRDRESKAQINLPGAWSDYSSPE